MTIGFSGVGPKAITSISASVSDGSSSVGVMLSGTDGGSNTLNTLNTSDRMYAYNGTTWDRVRAGLTLVSASLSGVMNTLPWSFYSSGSVTRTDGQGGPLLATSLGELKSAESYAPGAEDNTNGVLATADKPLVTSTYSWSRFVNYGANITLNVKAGPGNVFSLYCINYAGVPRWLQLHNTATTPAGAAVPVYSFMIPLSSSITIDGAFFGMNGQNFATGIAFAFSTSGSNYGTGSLATDQNTWIQFK